MNDGCVCFCICVRNEHKIYDYLLQLNIYIRTLSAVYYIHTISPYTRAHKPKIVK